MGDLEMPFILSPRVWAPSTPARQTLAEQTPSGPQYHPSWKRKGERKRPKEANGRRERKPLCAPRSWVGRRVPGGVGGGVETFPAGSLVSSASFPGPSPPSSAPRPRSWLGAAAERGLEVSGNFSIPGTLGRPGA